MNGRLWTDIAESESSVIFVDDIRRDFLSDDLVKKSLLVSLASLEEYREIKKKAMYLLRFTSKLGKINLVGHSEIMT